MSFSFGHRVVANGDVAIHVNTCGPEDGKLVVLLHGFPARWASWREVMPRLAKAGFFVVAPDQRGYGASSKPKNRADYSMVNLVADVAAIIKDFGRERAHLIGHDFGGGVTWSTAMSRPELVERVVTCNSVHPIGFSREIGRISQLIRSWYVFFFLLPWIPEWLLSRKDYKFLKEVFEEDGLSAETIADLLEGLRPEGALTGAINWYRQSFRDAASKAIKPAKVTVPVMVLWGDRERHLVPELAQPPADWVDNARVEHLPKASHWVQHDEPEKVSALIIEHLQAG